MCTTFNGKMNEGAIEILNCQHNDGEMYRFVVVQMPDIKASLRLCEVTVAVGR